MLEPDQSLDELLIEHQMLVNGNNILGLKPIRYISPRISDLDDFDICLNIIINDIELASQQLADHLNKTAYARKDFAPFWKRDTTFENSVNEFPDSVPRFFFERYRTWLDRNQHKARLHLIEQMKLLPFHKYKLPDIKYEMRRMDYNYCGLITAIYYGIIAEAYFVANEFTRAFLITSVLTLAAVSLISSDIKDFEIKTYEKFMKHMLLSEAKKCDHGIDLIQKYA